MSESAGRIPACPKTSEIRAGARRLAEHSGRRHADIQPGFPIPGTVPTFSLPGDRGPDRRQHRSRWTSTIRPSRPNSASTEEISAPRSRCRSSSTISRTSRSASSTSSSPRPANGPTRRSRLTMRPSSIRRDDAGDGTIPLWSAAKAQFTPAVTPGDHLGVLSSYAFRNFLWNLLAGVEAPLYPTQAVGVAGVTISVDRPIYAPGETISVLVIPDQPTTDIAGTLEIETGRLRRKRVSCVSTDWRASPSPTRGSRYDRSAPRRKPPWSRGSTACRSAEGPMRRRHRPRRRSG